MVTAADIKIITERWKRATLPLVIHEQDDGGRIVKIVEDYNGQEIMRFDNPSEAAAFILLMGVLKEQDMNKRMARFMASSEHR